MNPKLVTVIIPAYNCEKTIGQAVNSILTQSYRNVEVIVVNDNCTDNTASIVREMQKTDSRLKIINSQTNDQNRFNKKLNRNINAGYSARNDGLKIAQGDYITFQDGDDISLKNRIEIQVKLLEKYNAIHITTDWFRLDENYIGKSFDLERYINDCKLDFIGPKEITMMARKNKSLLVKLIGSWHKIVPFSIKRLRFINKFLLGGIEPYPGVTGIPLFKREVLDKVRFRPLQERVWPSFMGRGADRDFSFQVAETFKNSYVFFIPLYMWRVNNENEKYGSILKKYIE